MDVNGDARRVVRKATPWLIWLGRVGFAAKGIVYTLIGVLALQAMVGAGAQTTDSAGALKEVGQAPFGKFLLIAIGLGIVGYALWRFVQAFMDTENKGMGGKGLAVRVGYAVIAVIHIGLAMSAFAIASGTDGGNGDSTPGWTAQLMSQPFGQWLVGIVGGIVIAIGAVQFYRAYSLKFRRKLKLSEMSATEEQWAIRLGRIGYAARGIAFGVIGTFLVVAAIFADPQQARGLDGALDTLARQPWGWVVLGSVAFGLIAYGIYMFVEARYRRMVIT